MECFQEDPILFYALSPPAAFDLISAAAVPDLLSQYGSSFVGYSGSWGVPQAECQVSEYPNPWNIHRRVIGVLRRIPMPKPEAKRKAEEGNRGFRHMMRERQRREKLSQNYADLYSMLLPRPKADKNSIVQSAVVYLRTLKREKEELRRRNHELKTRIAWSNARQDAAKIELRLDNPTSAIDSIIGALRCMKDMDVKANEVRAGFSGGELAAVMSIATEVTTSEVEKAVEGALVEIERKLLMRLPRTRSMRGKRCHAENLV